jgi:hypothetical protein
MIKIHPKATIENDGIKNVTCMVKSVQPNEPNQTMYSVGDKLDYYGIFELCQPVPHRPPCFALKIRDKALAYIQEVEDKNRHITYKPTNAVPWMLPQEPQAYEREQTLFQEIRNCLYSHVDTPKETDLDVLACWTMATWLQEKWISFPYLNFYGSHSCGKSRLNEVLGRLVHRGWNCTYVSTASLFRVVDSWHPTLLIDEIEPLLRQQEIVSLLNSGYRRGSTVPRQTAQTDGSFKTEFYRVDGFKTTSGIRELPATLRSRSIVLHMRSNTRPVRLFIDEKACSNLRNQLLTYRFTKMMEDAGDAGAILKAGSADIEEMESFGQLLNNGRLAEIFFPIWKTAPTTAIKQTILDYAKNLDKERSEELQSSDEAVCLTAVLRCFNLGKMSHGLITIKDITEEINKTLSYNETWTYRKVGSLCGRLGFRKKPNHAKLTCIVWDNKLIEALKRDPRYKIAFEPEDPTPENAPAPHASPNQLEELPT